MPVSFQDRTPTLVQPMGWQFYRFWVRCSDFDLFLSPSNHVPPVYVRLSSFQLHSLGVEAAIAAVTRFINDCVMDLRKPPMLSRVDLYADFQGWLPEADDLSRFVTRSVKSHLYYVPAEEAHSGLRLSGFRFGRDQLVARLYDKTLEIATSRKEWMREVWWGRRPGEPVWRHEFSFDGS